MALSNTQVRRAATLLLEARARGERLSGWPADLPVITQDDAEAICESMARGLQQPIGGWKIGAMNPDSPVKHGLVRPFCGQIPRALIYDSGASLPWGALLRPVVEAEIIFVMGKDLRARDHPYTLTEVAQCVEGVMAGIEIPESRLIDKHPLGAMGMVADQGYAGRLVHAAARRDIRPEDLAAEQVSLRINERVVANGFATKAMGHPLAALQWLANHRSARGDGLRQGQIISSGSLTGIQPTRRGDWIIAEFSTLGSVLLTLD